MNLSNVSSQGLMYPFEHFNDQNGLTAPVRKIIQDEFGFIWLASSDGLYRYDGKIFKVYRNKLGDTNSIPNNIINDLYLHANGKIWIASNGGLCYFDHNDSKFHQITLPENLESLDKYRVHSVTADAFGQIWFATKTSLHLLNNRNELSKNINLPLSYPYTISKIFADSSEHLFIGTNTGELIICNLLTGNMNSTHVESRQSKQLNLLTAVTNMYSAGKNDLYTGSWNGGLGKIHYTDSSIFSKTIENDYEKELQKDVVTSIAKLKPDLWWIGTHGAGIALYDPVQEQYIGAIKTSLSNPSGLSDDYINDLFIDRSGIVWVGTDDGLNKYDKLSHQFFSFSIPNQKNEKSIYRRPSCILEDRYNEPGKFLWISVPGVGLFHFNRKIHSFEYVPLKTSAKILLKDRLIHQMIYNHNNEMILCMDSGLYSFDELKREVKSIVFPQNQKIEKIRHIMEDHSGNYWMNVSMNGIYYYKPYENTCQHFYYDSLNTNSLPDNSIFCIREDHNHIIWIGTQNKGLSSYNPQSGTFTNYEHNRLQARSLPDNNVYDVYEDANNYLWIATENGLARMNPQRNELKIFTTSEGLSNNDIFFITPDKDGRMWLGTNNGLSVLNPRDGSIINYAQMDGLASNRIDGASLCCADKFIYFGTNGMITGCKPDLLLKNQIPPVVIITSVKVHGQEVPIFRSGWDLKEINLNYSENNFNPEFIALNYTNSSKNKYAYLLEGYDKYWTYCGSQTSTAYTNLPGGHYTFRLKATNNDGVWSTKSDQLRIVIQPPFWNTVWFYIILAVIISAIIYFYFKIKINQIVHMQKLRLNIARDLHDDVGSTLSSINMTSSMADHLMQTGKNHKELFQNIQSASKRAMEMMNDIIWSIKPENDKPEMLFTRMRQYASEILETAAIEFEFTIQEKSVHANIPLGIRKDLFMIFKEAINNLVKYSNSTKVSITLIIEKSELQLDIVDNGIGFDRNAVHKGNGLKNMQERAEAMSADFKIQSQPFIGTQIYLFVKF